MFDFPSTPVNGQIYGAYIYQNGAWMQNSANTVVTADARNRIVNPAMVNSQEFGGGVTAVSGGYPVDQWFIGVGGITINGAQRYAMTTPDGSPYILNTSLATVKGSLAAGDHWYVAQPIEGNRIADLQWGTAAAKQVVLRFNFSAAIAGTYGVALRNGAGNRSWTSTFTVAASTWTKVVLTIPGDTTGTWTNDNTIGLYVGVAFAVGATYVAPATGWTAGNFLAPPGMTNGAGTAGGAFYLADVGLYADPQKTNTPPPWQAPDYADELLACQRYWRSFSTLVVDVNSTSQSGILSPAMRIAPTITGGGPGFTVGYSLPTHCHIYQTARAYQTITANARM